MILVVPSLNVRKNNKTTLFPDIRSDHFVNTSWYHIPTIEHVTLRLPKVSKSTTEDGSLCNQLPVWVQETDASTSEIRLKTFFITKFRQDQTTLNQPSYAAIPSDSRGTSHDALRTSLLTPCAHY